MLRGVMGFIGRLFISLIFIASGLEKILNWDHAVESLRLAISTWSAPGIGLETLQGVVQEILPHLSFLLMLSTACELLGALCVLLGVYVRLGAFLLFVFLSLATLVMHPFWAVQGAEYEIQVVTFLRNLSIIGGLLILFAYGSSAQPRKSLLFGQRQSSRG